jgi:hypothetical protein
MPGPPSLLERLYPPPDVTAKARARGRFVTSCRIRAAELGQPLESPVAQWPGAL